jgi:hexosaminidase
MMDCSRHFEPIDVIERTLDGMAAVKMNVFHWHLTDDQGFRIESRVFPKLTGMGSDGLFYTQRQARDIVRYARERGIRVVPEFDMPGHTTSWMVGYPELASAPGQFAIERHFGIFNPVMDPTQDRTYVFLDKFIAEMATIFPDCYVHIGGDENNGVEWRQNPHIQTFMREHNLKDTAALQGYFNQQLLMILTKHEKRMIGWDEILTPKLPKDVVVQSWRGFDSLATGARQRYNGILSAGYYLGHMDSAAAYYQIDPLPPDRHLTSEQDERILGGEVCIWGEYVDARDIDSRVWPITAAIAERLWSPRSVADVDDMYRRLPLESLRLEGLGLTQLTQEDASLRALAGTGEIGSLRILAHVLEPAVFKVRGPWSEKHGVSQLDPLNHLVDALPPDPTSRHVLERVLNAYLEDPIGRPNQKAILALTFRSWVNAEPELMHVISAAPLLAEAKPCALELAELGSLGLEAMSYLSAGTAAPAGWKERKISVLDRAEQPDALVRFTVLKPLRDLVNSVQEQ